MVEGLGLGQEFDGATTVAVVTFALGEEVPVGSGGRGSDRLKVGDEGESLASNVGKDDFLSPRSSPDPDPDPDAGLAFPPDM